MKVRALCWVNCGGWHRAGEVFDVEDHSALPGLVETVEEDTDSSAVAEASAQNDEGERIATAPLEPRSDSEKPQKTAKKRGRKA